MLDQAELGRRLKQAREARGLTQEEASREMGLARATMTQIENGQRTVSGLELSKFAYVYARHAGEFLAPAFTADNLTALFPRADGADDLRIALRDCIALGHQLQDLETQLGITRSTNAVASYPTVRLESKWEAIQSGQQAAIEERRRLGSGVNPLGDLPSMLEAHGIRTGLISLPPGVSGLMISEPTVGLFVVVNRDHPPVRQRFSWCHEYAHLLLDRARLGHVSREADRADLLEVRANVFAACFLMPEEGVRQFVATLGKGSSSRLHADIFDESGVVPVDTRTAGGSQDLQIYDVVKLAHHFGVSVLSALYRLLNLRLISDPQFKELKALDDAQVSKQVAALLGLAEVTEEDHFNAFHRRYLVLALEAFRREKISRRKLTEIAKRLEVGAAEIEEVVERLGLGEAEPAPALTARL